MVIVFALMADGEYGHRVVVFDFEQRDITRPAEGNHHFAQKSVVGERLAACEWKLLQQLDAFGDGFARVQSGARVLRGQKGKESFKVFSRRFCVANLVVHLPAFFFALARMTSSSCNTSSDET